MGMPAESFRIEEQLLHSLFELCVPRAPGPLKSACHVTNNRQFTDEAGSSWAVEIHLT